MWKYNAWQSHRGVYSTHNNQFVIIDIGTELSYKHSCCKDGGSVSIIQKALQLAQDMRYLSSGPKPALDQE